MKLNKLIAPALKAGLRKIVRLRIVIATSLGGHVKGGLESLIFVAKSDFGKCCPSEQLLIFNSWRAVMD